MSKAFAVVATLCAVLAWTPVASAQDYVLGVDDVIAISVWMHPELERVSTIGSDGTITYPPLGSVQAAGLSPKQLGDKLASQLGSFLRQTTAVTVTVTQFMSRSVYVSGAVAKPGRYGFERMPSVIDVISQAGGALTGADLGGVHILRKEGETRRVIEANVAASLRDGVGVPLPDLKPGDTVVVPALTTAGGSSTGEGVGVLGQVLKPGVYPAAAGQDLWAILATAGGIGPLADLSNIHVITRQGGSGQAVVTINLRDALKRGARAPFLVRSGDIVFVASTADSGPGRALVAFQTVLSASRDLIGLVLIRDIVNQ